MKTRKILAALLRKKTPEEEKAGEVSPPAFFDFSENERNPLSLRNGFSVTREKDPTIAEQWVNILNYSGESQTEGEYEETEENHTPGGME